MDKINSSRNSSVKIIREQILLLWGNADSSDETNFHCGGIYEFGRSRTHSCSICGKENCVLFEFNGSQYCLEHYQQITNEQSLKPQLSSSENRINKRHPNYQACLFRKILAMKAKLV